MLFILFIFFRAGRPDLILGAARPPGRPAGPARDLPGGGRPAKKCDWLPGSGKQNHIEKNQINSCMLFILFIFFRAGRPDLILGAARPPGRPAGPACEFPGGGCRAKKCDWLPGLGKQNHFAKNPINSCAFSILFVFFRAGRPDLIWGVAPPPGRPARPAC